MAMTWFKVDDSLTDHPKTIALEESKHFGPAMGLWSVAGSWCAKHLTDGAVPKRLIRKLGFKLAHAEALVAVRFWVVVEDGYQFHNWLKWQPSRESVLAKRTATAARVKRHRDKSETAVGNAVTPPVSNAPIDPVPTRPVPTRPRDTSVSPPRASSEPEAWVQVGKLYAERYTSQTSRPVALQIHRKAFEAIAVQAVGNLDDVRRSLDGFWQDEWASANGWPPGAWAKQFGRHLDGPADPVAEEAKRRADRKAQIARIDAEILGGSR